ncbi:hypothetical protein HA466_0306870 [Hirschfeldia incana]|nr:hypothetical protein HA466_0306870 [Hirschfeldia incana]
MDNIWVLPLLFLISFGVLAAYKRSKRRQNRKPPSPPGYPIIGNLHQLGVLPHQSLWKLSKKHGPVMLLNLGKVPMVILSSAETAKQALRDHDIHCCSRPTVAGLRELSYNNLDIAFSPFSEYWKEVRKLAVMELFSTKQVYSIKPIMDEQVKKLIDSVAVSASQKIPININETFLDLTKRVICKAALGVSFEGTGINSEEFNKLVREASEMLGSFSAADFFPGVGWIIDLFTGLQERREKSVRDLDAFYEYVMDLHKEQKKQGREDIVDLLLRLEKEGTVLGNDNLTRNHIKAILMNILLGGLETGSITMIWAMTEMARNPRVMKKVQSEIRSQIGNQSIISLDDTDKLTYLKMVIKETWRLHPSAKTRLHVNVWAIGRDPEIWKDPEEFLPERFMDNNIDAKGLNFELLPFGSGRRICPAIFMGTTMVECGLANMLYNFDWKLPDGIAVEDIDMEESPGLSVSKKSELLLVPTKYLDH